MGDRLAEWAALAASRLFGPVFALDAARVGRRLSTHLLRWLYLLILTGVLGLFFYAWRDDLHASGGVVHPSILTRFAENFFWVYSVTQFLVVCALTPAYTAAIITDEKERKTLDFLLVTTLTGREILFGKLAARLGALLTFVLAGLPVIALMQFFGGIEPRYLLMGTAMTLATVLSLSALSVAASVQMTRTRESVALAYIVPLVYFFLTVWIWKPRQGYSSPDLQSVVDTITAGNPIVAVGELNRDLGSTAAPDVVWWYVGFHAVIALLSLGYAAFRLRSLSEARPARARPRGRFGMMMALLLGRRSDARNHPDVSDAPVHWREVYVDPGSGGGFIRRLLIVGLLAAIVWPFVTIVYDVYVREPRPIRYYRNWSPLQEFQERTKVWACVVIGGLSMILLLRAAARGASAIAGERDRDTWVSLLGTPLTAREILWGKWAGCVWGQRGLMYLLAAVWVVSILTGSVNPITLAPSVAALAAYLYGFAWLGIRCSVAARNSRVAIARAIPAAIFLGGGYWIVLGCCCAGIGMSGAGSGSGDGIVYLSSFIAGITPPVVLVGLPAVEFKFLKDLNGRGSTAFGSLVFGGAAGALAWVLLAGLWREQALALFSVEANRQLDEQPLSMRPMPVPPRAGPPGNSDTSAPS